MSHTQLTCANGSTGQKTQNWTQAEGESFSLDYNRGYGMILDSNKRRYNFLVSTPPGTTYVSCGLAWDGNRWVGTAPKEFTVDTTEGGAMKVTCSL